MSSSTHETKTDDQHRPSGDNVSDHLHAATDEDAEKQPTPVQEDKTPPYTIFTTRQKQMLTLAAAFTALFSPLSAQTYLPALPLLSKDLHVSSTQINLTITTYMIFQGIVPMFIGSLADSGGRRPAYMGCFVVYIAANIGLALAPNYGSILGLRCLQSAGSSSTVALCSAVVADIITSAERGQYIGLTVVPTVLGPAIGPVIGGLLAEHFGWRSIFWFLAILAGVTIVLIALFMPETCRHIVGDGSTIPPPLYRSGLQILKYRQHGSKDAQKHKGEFKFKPPNVLDSLILLSEKETALLLISSSFVFAGFYCISTAMPTLLHDRYGFDETHVGLMYLPLAIGSIFAAIIAGPFMNRNYIKHCTKLGIPHDRSRQQDLSKFPIERARLEIGLPCLALAGTSLIAWGWAMHNTTHVAVLCVTSGLLGVGMIGFNNTSSVLLVDLHPGKAGTATASNNLTRCLLGAGASAATIPMINSMGVGGTFSLLGGLYFFCFGPLLTIMLMGKRWRSELVRKRESQQKQKETHASD